MEQSAASPSPEAVILADVAHIIDLVPGPAGEGLATAERAALFAFLDQPSPATWAEARRAKMTKADTIWVATMRRAQIGMYKTPTRDQVVDAIYASANPQL